MVAIVDSMPGGSGEGFIRRKRATDGGYDANWVRLCSEMTAGGGTRGPSSRPQTPIPSSLFRRTREPPSLGFTGQARNPGHDSRDFRGYPESSRITKRFSLKPGFGGTSSGIRRH